MIEGKGGRSRELGARKARSRGVEKTKTCEWGSGTARRRWWAAGRQARAAENIERTEKIRIYEIAQGLPRDIF